MPADCLYLDHNATAPPLAEVVEAVREASLRHRGNPASQHELGRRARRALEDARERIAGLLGAKTAGQDADRVIFTSGGTEANNLALTGLVQNGQAPRRDSPRESPIPTPRGRIVVSAIEHPSVARMAERLSQLGWRIDALAANADGIVSAAELGETLHAETRLVSVMLANNETGVLQPVAQIAAACRPRGILVHTDAVQVVGKLPVDFRSLGVDALSVAAHKFHGPLGVGALVLRHGATLQPSLYGGFQQAGARPGTESVALAIGMHVALEAWAREADARRQRMAGLRDRFERSLLAGDPHALVIGARAPRLPHTSNVAFCGLDRQALMMALDLAGVACSTGSACASGSSEPSPALVAMGLPDEQISSSLRFSLGALTTAEEIDEATGRILNVCNQLRHRN